MAVGIKFKAKTMTGRTKEEVVRKLKGSTLYSTSNTFWNYGSGVLIKERSGSTGRTVRLFSLEKRRRKTKEISRRVIARGKRKGEIEIVRETVRKGHWVAFYYDIPEVLLDMKNTKQGARSFKMVQAQF